MKGDRAHKQGHDSHAYEEGDFEIVLMGNDKWYVYDDNIWVGPEFDSLREARKACKERPEELM
jgi:hypothetical protein